MQAHSLLVFLLTICFVEKVTIVWHLQHPSAARSAIDPVLCRCITHAFKLCILVNFHTRYRKIGLAVIKNFLRPSSARVPQVPRVRAKVSAL